MGILQTKSIKMQAYDLIKSRILDQTYGFGEKLNMTELSQELGISNSPIREALSILESENLIVFKAHVGPSVVEVDQKLYDEVKNTAKILLLGSYDQCLESNLIPKLIIQMEGYLAQQKLIVEDLIKEKEFAKLAIDFDVSLIKVLENETLNNLYESLFNLLYLIVIFDHKRNYIERRQNIAEHEEILHAIKTGNPDETKKMISKHYGRLW